MYVYKHNYINICWFTLNITTFILDLRSIQGEGILHEETVT